MNGAIRASEVRVVADDGEQLGVMALRDAISAAEESGLDLVEVAPTAKPPVCRIMDYGKFKYELSKKAKEAKKKQTVVQIKEIKLGIKTDEHDLNFKIKNGKKFLKEGNKVKVVLTFRGREITHPGLGLDRLKYIAEALEEDGTVESRPKMEGRRLAMVLAPVVAKSEIKSSKGKAKAKASQEAKPETKPKTK